MVFMHRRIDRKNISGPGREVSVKLLAVTQMIDKLLRLLPDGDTGSRRNSHVTVDAYLRMKEEMAVCRLTVRIDMGFVERIDLIHDLYSQSVCLFIMAITAGLSLKLHQMVDALSQADHTKHGSKAVSSDKALFCQKVIFKETTLFHLKRIRASI